MSQKKYFFYICYIYHYLLHLSVNTRSVIGQFCGPYFTVRPLNGKHKERVGAWDFIVDKKASIRYVISDVMQFAPNTKPEY